MVILRKVGNYAAQLTYAYNSPASPSVAIVLNNSNNNLSASYIKNSHCIPTPKIHPNPSLNLQHVITYHPLLRITAAAIDYGISNNRHGS